MREAAGADRDGVCGGVLAEEMGLGKTVEVMALVLSHAAPSADTLAIDPLALHGRPLVPCRVAAGTRCSLCARRLAAHEMVHVGAPVPTPTSAQPPCGKWRYCQLCCLSSLRSPPVIATLQAPQAGAPSGGGAAPARRVRFAIEAGDSARAEVHDASRAPSKRHAESDGLGGEEPGPKARCVPPNAAPAADAAPIAKGLAPCGDVRLVRLRLAGAALPVSRGSARTGLKVRVELPPPPPLPACACTLIVTPPALLAQWLDELLKHAPALAARTLVYAGLHEMGADADGSPSPALLGAVDRAAIVLTSFNVLEREIWYGAHVADSADGLALRRTKRYARPRTLLRMRRWWRLVIDEAQAVQARSAGGTLLSNMTALIEADHRWCVTGTPLSPERGLVDAFDLLRFLKSTHPLAVERAAFTAALRALEERSAAESAAPGAPSLLELLGPIMWRTSKRHVQLGMPPPVQHLHAVDAAGAERAWALRDAAVMGIAPTALPPLRAVGEPAVGVTDPEPRPERCFDLQRALTHAQLSRAWIGLSGEGQLETGTSSSPFEQMQRAVELLYRKKQRDELMLCERLNLIAAFHVALGDPDAARACYERVGRVFEWGVAEDGSAGDQHDNAEETLRQWWCERAHSLFRLICLHHDGGRSAEADEAYAALDALSAEFIADAQKDAARASRRLERVRRAIGEQLGESNPDVERDEHGGEAVAMSGELTALRAWAESLRERMRAARETAAAELQGTPATIDAGGGEGEAAGGGGVGEYGADGASAAEAAADAAGVRTRRSRGEGVLEFWDVDAVEGTRLSRERGARRERYAALGGQGADGLLQRRRMEASLLEGAAAKVLYEAGASLRHQEKLLAREREAVSADGGGATAGSLAARGALLGSQQRLVRMLGEEARHESALELAEVAQHGATEEIELYKLPRALPEGADTWRAALRDHIAAAELQTAACRQLDVLARELLDERMAELSRHRAAQRPARLAFAPLRDREPIQPRPGDHDAEHAAAAADASHACAATLALQLALLEWLAAAAAHYAAAGPASSIGWAAGPAGEFSARRLLYGSAPPQLEAKLRLVAHCEAAASLGERAREQVAQWLLAELPDCIVVPFRRRPPPASEAAAGEVAEVGGAARVYRLPDGDEVDVVCEVAAEKDAIWDGAEMVGGKYDGEVSGATYERGPWHWSEAAKVWRRDAHPHDVLVLAPCGHCYSEQWWAAKLSTTIDVSSRGTLRARRATCCAPIADGKRCNRVLSANQGLRVTHCNPPRAPMALAARAPGAWDGAWDGARVVHGVWGARVEAAVRLMLELRARAEAAGDAGGAKVVVFSRFEQTLSLLARACAMHAIRTASSGGARGSLQHEVSLFCAEPAVQALLLSAHRNASGLTLTAACHVLILEPQIDAATEQQMIGRVHRIGQTRQTHVHRIVVRGSFEEGLGAERQALAQQQQEQPEAV